ncbi:ribonuclease III [Patescibacteria group bacterium]|nr:ribonuclease III [Patescibacteria group bacterium]MCG2694622.1 ribonuclease III [Candidatus Parcubacteria bacterium]
MKDFANFEEKIGVVFNNKEILKQAFTHRSYVNEHGGSYSSHNERLEFLGDAVLELVVSSYLYKKFPEEKEGVLTSYRAALVNTITISTAAKKLGINDFLLLSKGEAKDTGRARTFILADVFEAVIGAIYLDQGYDVVHKFIADNIFPLTDEVIKKRLWQDSKSFFQEKAQEIVSVTPIYKVLEETGPDHAKNFKVGVFLNDEKIAEGDGVSKQEAEQEAAKNGLEIKNWFD